MSLEIPPRIETEEAEQLPSSTSPEAAPQEAPEPRGTSRHEAAFAASEGAPLDFDTILGGTEAKDAPLLLTQALDRFVDHWRNTAYDGNIFNDQVLRDMWKTRSEAVAESMKLARAEEKEDRVVAIGKIMDLLDQLNEQSETVKQAIAENAARLENIRGESDTPKERQQDLKRGIDALTRAGQRETIAESYAERNGIEAERADLLAAEAEYAAAVKATHAKFKIFRKKDVPAEVQEKYDAACLSWRSAIDATMPKGENLTAEQKREAVQAKMIGFRDTVFRAEEARIRARQEGLDERGKTVLGKTAKWAAAGPKALLKAYTGIFDVAGRGLSKLHGEETQEKWAARYSRAGRIIGSAALATALTGGMGGLGVGLSFALRASRGAFGAVSGSAAAYAAGNAYKKRGEEHRGALSQSVRQRELVGMVDSVHLKQDQKLYRKGNAKSRAETQKKVEVFAAVLAGGAASLASAEGIHQSGFTHLEAVKGASRTLHEMDARVDTSHGVSTGQQVGAPVAHAPEAMKPPAALPAIEEVRVRPGEGAFKFSSEFKESLQKAYPDPKTAPEYLQKLLNQRPENISRGFGFTDAHGSRMMHVGDKLTVDAHGRVIFHDGATNKETLLINEKGEVANRLHEKMHPFHPAKHPSEARMDDPLAGDEAHETGQDGSAVLADHPNKGIPLPAGVDPNSPEATAFYNRAYNPTSFIHTPKPFTDTGLPRIDVPGLPEEPVLHSDITGLDPSRFTLDTPPASAAPLPFTDHAGPMSTAPEAHPAAETAPMHGPVGSSESGVAAAADPAISKLTGGPTWQEYRGHPSMAALDTPARPGTPAATVRQDLFNIMKKSGVGPEHNETVERYVARAQETIEKGKATPPTIVETPNHFFVAHGGDLSARMILAKEFLRANIAEHPQMGVFVENDPGVKSHAFLVGGDILTARSTESVILQSAEEAHVKLPPITSDMKVLF